MTAPTPDSAPESTNANTGTSANDAAAQAALAAAEQDAPADAWDEKAAKVKWDKIKAERDKFNEELKKLRPLAAEAEKSRQASLTNEQKLQEQLAAKDKELAEFRAQSVVRDAAVAAGLPENMRKFITATDPETALAQAKELAELVQTNAPAAPTKPDLKQGTRGVKQPTAKNSEEALRSLFR
jgi:hypothetical protein